MSQGVPSPVPLGHKEILFPFIFSGYNRNWSEGGHKGESARRRRESENKRATYLWDVFLPFPTAEEPGGQLSAKLPRPCKHSGTSWGLESAESLPAGDVEMGQIKGMRNE